LILDRPGQRPGGVGADGFPLDFYEKIQVNMKRDQESIENHHKIMHTSAKHYFGVVWTHLGTVRAVKSRLSVIFHGFARFWEPSPAQLAPSRPRPAELPLANL